MNKQILSITFFLILIVAQCVAIAQDPIGEQRVDNQRLPTGQRIQPAGELVSFHGRPVDLKLSVDGKLIFAKDRNALRVIDAETMKLVQTVESPGGASLVGLAVTKSGNVYFTNSKNGLHVFSPDPANTGRYLLARTIILPDDSFPCGVKISDDETTAYVCLSKKNSVAIIDLKTDQVKQTINTGVAPFDLLIQSGRLIVSNIGGRIPGDNDRTAPSAGTPTVVDARGIASTGAVTVIDLATSQVDRTINVGRHPSMMSAGIVKGSTVVCNTNDDSINWIDDNSGATRQYSIKPKFDIPFGSMPSAIIPYAGRSVYFVALAGNNSVAVVTSNHPADDPPMNVTGLIPTAWYPVALDMNETHLFVACVKGIGSRSNERDESKGRNSHDHLGTIEKIRLADIFDENQRADWTKTSLENARIPRLVSSFVSPLVRGSEAESDTTANAPPVVAVPIPKRLGDPSTFKHVIYVIKENRTYDQVFGDIEEARGEPKLCIFPEPITPNHHALARRFGILDNYYCNGVLSADGHSWATEGNVTPYLERAFGGFARSYTFGDDPITYSSSGFVWDHVLDAGLSFRNYGEMNYSKPPAGMKYQDVWQSHVQEKPIEFTHAIGIERLRNYSCMDYPGWNMMIPDVLRIERFLKEFRQFEKNDGLPSLCIVYLPQDHLGGGITGRSHMADNDQAIGKLVEAVSNSVFWKDTVIFINEDDPQNGFDHIDGHRSICLAISAYSRPGVNHQFYNQTSVLRTMLHILGLPPMNQQDAAAPLMFECFQATPDLDPYQRVASTIPLNESPPPKSEQSSLEKKWRTLLATVPIERTGMKTEQDENNLNRFIWHESQGWETPYPEDWSGAHGRGLQPLGLTHDLDPSDENNPQ